MTLWNCFVWLTDMRIYLSCGQDKFTGPVLDETSSRAGSWTKWRREKALSTCWLLSVPDDRCRMTSLFPAALISPRNSLYLQLWAQINPSPQSLLTEYFTTATGKETKAPSPAKISIITPLPYLHSYHLSSRCFPLHWDYCSDPMDLSLHIFVSQCTSTHHPMFLHCCLSNLIKTENRAALGEW